MRRVIEYWVWVHVPTGLTASIRGACPWGFGPQPTTWERRQDGWSIEHPDGTIGIGRAPFPTAAEAQAWIDAHPTFQGMGAG